MSLKWGLLQAFGITHSEAKMTGEFARKTKRKRKRAAGGRGKSEHHLPWKRRRLRMRTRGRTPAQGAPRAPRARVAAVAVDELVERAVFRCQLKKLQL